MQPADVQQATHEKGSTRRQKDITVLICTRNRASSLRETLDCLARAYRMGISVEIVVVDNCSQDSTEEVVRSFQNRLPVRYLFETRLGKAYALNRALDNGDLGQIIAVLDDDMSPCPNWFQGVKAICDRWPDKDFFSGPSHIIWPEGPRPGWAESSRIRSWAFSVADYSGWDRLLENGRWFPGGHFWFRKRVLTNRRRFEPVWITEPKFMLQLQLEGYQGMSGPDAVTGHRIQRSLLSETAILERARLVGRSFAEVRLRPYRPRVKHAVFAKKYPVMARLYCAANLIGWSCRYTTSQILLSGDRRFREMAFAMERMIYHWELLRILREDDEYRILRRS